MKKKIIVHYATNVTGGGYAQRFDALCGASTDCKTKSVVGIRNVEWVNCKRCIKSINKILKEGISKRATSGASGNSP